MRPPGRWRHLIELDLRDRFGQLRLPNQLTASESPRHRLSRYAVGLWYVAEFLLAMLGIFRLLKEQWRGASGEGRGAAGENDVALTLALSQRERGRVPPSPFPSPPSPWLWGLLLVGCLMASHAVYWTDMRMRAPIMPAAALLRGERTALPRSPQQRLQLKQNPQERQPSQPEHRRPAPHLQRIVDSEHHLRGE